MIRGKSSSNRERSLNRDIQNGLSVEEVDKKLRDKCGFGLYNFAFSLAVVLSDFPMFGFPEIWVLKNAKIPGIDDVRNEIQRLIDVRLKLRGLAKPLRKHLCKLPNYHRGKGNYYNAVTTALTSDYSPDEAAIGDALTLTVYKLDGAIEIIDKEIRFLHESMWKPFKKKSGKSAEPKLIIQAFWSMVIRDGRAADMKYIDGLINWFSARLDSTDYGRVLKYEPNRTSVRRFLQVNRMRLDKDLSLFFSKSKEAKEKTAIDKRAIQIRFNKAKPDIVAFAKNALKKECPLITFYESKPA